LPTVRRNYVRLVPFLLSLTAVAASCDDGGDKDAKGSDKSGKDAKSEDDAKGDDKAAAADAKAADAKDDGDAKKAENDGPDPCALLAETKLREVAKIPEAATMEVGVDKFTKQLCQYKWKNPDETKRFSGRVDVAIPKRSFADAGSAKAGYDKSLEELAKAMTTGGKKPEFEAVEGIGDAASWYAGLAQLSVVSGNRLFHVSISQMGNDKAAALALAKDVAKAILAT